MKANLIYRGMTGQRLDHRAVVKGVKSDPSSPPPLAHPALTDGTLMLSSSRQQSLDVDLSELYAKLQRTSRDFSNERAATATRAVLDSLADSQERPGDSVRAPAFRLYSSLNDPSATPQQLLDEWHAVLLAKPTGRTFEDWAKATETAERRQREAIAGGIDAAVAYLRYPGPSPLTDNGFSKLLCISNVVRRIPFGHEERNKAIELLAEYYEPHSVPHKYESDALLPFDWRKYWEKFSATVMQIPKLPFPGEGPCLLELYRMITAAMQFACGESADRLAGRQQLTGKLRVYLTERGAMQPLTIRASTPPAEIVSQLGGRLNQIFSYMWSRPESQATFDDIYDELSRTNPIQPNSVTQNLKRLQSQLAELNEEWLFFYDRGLAVLQRNPSFRRPKKVS